MTQEVINKRYYIKYKYELEPGRWETGDLYTSHELLEVVRTLQAHGFESISIYEEVTTRTALGEVHPI